MKSKNKKFKKSILLIIDALRYDIVDNKKLYPVLSSLIKKGVYKKVIANACSTQFVLPSIFSSTYPLDNGGYNFGIRDRKSSYIESIKKKYNRKTIMISNCNQMGIGNSYDRGFDEILTTYDFRLIIEQRINRTLLYEVNLYKQGLISKNAVIKKIVKEFSITLNQVDKYYNTYDKSLWPNKLKKINKFIYENSKKEKKILLNNPFIVINKMLHISGGIYWLSLGKTKYKSFRFFYERIKIALVWRSKKIIANQRIWPFYFLPHHQVLFEEMLQKICKKITNIKNEDWHIHMHIMDLHDARAINRFVHILNRYRFFFIWLIERILGNTKHKFIYASSLMYIDKCLKYFFAHLKKERINSDTLLLITADHGSDYAESPRGKVEVGERNHYEYIDVPIILSHKLQKDIKRNICDSMSISTTLLDMLNVPTDKSYKGKSIFKNGPEFVISENAGSGNSDLKRKDLFFTITTLKYKLMMFLKDKTLKITKLYDIQKDPKELNNLLHSKEYKYQNKIVKNLVKTLFKERIEIFNERGIFKLSECFTIHY